MDKIRVVALTHPFKIHERVEKEVDPCSIQEVIDGLNIPEEFSLHAFVDGEPVSDRSMPLEGGELVVLRTLPSTNDQESRKAGFWSGMMIIGGIALTVASAGLMSPLGLTAIGMGIVGTVGLGVTIGITWLRNNLKLPGDQQSMEDPEQNPHIRGSRNRAHPWGAVPVVLGRHLMTPPFGASPYTVLRGSDQYLHQLFVAGQKNLNISNLKIGDTDLSAYDDVTYEIRDGVVGSSNLYPSQVDQLTVKAKLEPSNAVERTTAPETQEINVTMSAPRGMVKYDQDDGRKIKISVNVDIYITESGTSFSSTPDATVTFTGKSSDAIRKSKSFSVSSAQYDVKLVRTTGSHGSQASDVVYWTSMSSINFAEPISDAMQSQLTRVAFKIKATDQLQGVVDQFNFIAESKVPDYDGSGSGPAAWSLRGTSNPASLALYVLRGEQNPDPVDDTRINWESFEEWHDWCATNGMEYNAIIEGHKTVSELLSDIASVGRAFIYPLDGEYTVVVDAPRPSAVQFFTPRNSSDFSGSKDFEEPPHALKMQFINEDQGYQWDERIVYDDGYDASNATKFEKIKLKGVTNSDQAWKTGRYHIAVARLRPETYSLKVDIEGLVCTSGDLVRVTHDVPLWGLYAGRIHAVGTDGNGNVTTIFLEEPVTMESGKSYAVRVRLADGTNVYAEVDTTTDGETDTLTLSTASSENIQAADLIMYGEADTESIEAIVTGVDIDENLDCTLTLKDYSPAIFDADSGTIPAFDSNVTSPSEKPQQPSAPAVEEVRSGEEVAIQESDGSVTNRIAVNIDPPDGGDSYTIVYGQLSYKINGTDMSWKTTPEQDISNPTLYIEDVEEGIEYALKARVITSEGVASDWTAQVLHTVGTVGWEVIRTDPDGNGTVDSGKILTLDGTIVVNSGVMKSGNYDAGVDGWKLDNSGNIEIAGTIHAKDGDIGDWLIIEDAIASDDAVNAVALRGSSKALEIKDGSGAMKIITGYMKNAPSGWTNKDGEQLTANHYGSYVGGGNFTVADGAKFENGDYLINFDAAYRVVNDQKGDVIVLGSLGSGDIGLDIGGMLFGEMLGGGDASTTYDGDVLGGGNANEIVGPTLGGGTAKWGARGLMYSMLENTMYLDGSAVISGTLSIGQVRDAGALATKDRIDAAEELTDGIIEKAKLGATVISGGYLRTDLIKAGTITASEIAAGTITASEIAAGTITANEIAVSNLFASSITATGDIKSDDYGSNSGWKIDGGNNSVEFNNGTFGGTIKASGGFFEDSLLLLSPNIFGDTGLRISGVIANTEWGYRQTHAELFDHIQSIAISAGSGKYYKFSIMGACRIAGDYYALSYIHLVNYDEYKIYDTGNNYVASIHKDDTSIWAPDPGTSWIEFIFMGTDNY